ncbi:SMR family transporter [Halodesulfovibrio aestuarii]|uniref:SMR family transporter n=1 Tax=Halodesulfovibrio aestuarii TaxID=126333 RepID=UPI000412196E
MTNALLWILSSIVLDIAANWAIKRSRGFSLKRWGILSIVLVICAFLMLKPALSYFHLSVAYALWGVGGIVGSFIVDRIFFHVHLSPRIIPPILLMVIGIILINVTTPPIR